MNDLLVGICSYMAINTSNGTNACHTAVNQMYNISSIKPIFDQEQHQLEAEGAALYQSLPGHTPLGAASFLTYDIYKKDFKIPLSNHINLEYYNYNTETCNLHWEF